jgi:hypothetical protein
LRCIFFPPWDLALVPGRKTTAKSRSIPDIVEPPHTIVELHSNFTIDALKSVENGVLPANHAQHETIESTHGFTDWFEVGFSIFT